MPEITERLISDLSVIVVTWNGDDLLRNCLSSMVSVYGGGLEIIVVDNANQCSTRELVNGFDGCKYIPTVSNLGFAGGNNIGLAYCSRRYVLLLNNDTIVHEDSFTPMVRYMTCNPKVAVVQGTMVLPLCGGELDVCGFLMTPCGPRYGRFNKKSRMVLSGKGACLMFRKSVIDDLDGVLFYDCFRNNHEEVDFCHRVWLMGYEVWFLNTPAIDHLNGRTFERLPEDRGEVTSLMIANYYSSLFTLLEWRNIFGVCGKSLFLDVVVCTLMLFSLKWRKAYVYPRALVILFLRIKMMVKVRRAVQRRRRLSDRELFAKVLVRPPFGSYFYSIRGRCVDYGF